MQDLKYINIKKILFETKQQFKKAKIKNPALEAEILLSLAIKKPKGFLYTHPEYLITKKQETKFKTDVKRRLKGQPVAYILGYKEFYSLKFLVNKNVLIPRPETEMMVEECLKNIKENNCGLKSVDPRLPCLPSGRKPGRKIYVIDVGTGSGCIPITLAKKNYNGVSIKYYGIDISENALIMAKKNAKLQGVEKKIKFVKSDLMSCFLDSRDPSTRPVFSGLAQDDNHLIIITANLPYLSENIYKKNYQNLKFEPKNALLAGDDGLKYYHRLLIQIKNILQMTCLAGRQAHCTLHITCFLEINPEQKNGIKKIIKINLPQAKIEFKKDLSGRIRLVIIHAD